LNGSTPVTAASVQSIAEDRNSAGLGTRRAFVTANLSGQNSNENVRSVASAAIHVKPAVLLIRTRRNVPDAPTGPPEPATDKSSDRPVAPAPNVAKPAASIVNCVNVNEPATVNNPTKSIDAFPDTSRVLVPSKSLPKLNGRTPVTAASVQSIA